MPRKKKQPSTKLAQHPDSDRLAEAIARCATVAVGTQRCIRCAKEPWWNEHDIASGEGSAEHGGRYNPPGIRAVYGSVNLVTAMLELLAHNRRLGVADTEAEVYPLVVTTLRADIERLLDLTDPGVRRILGVNVSRLTQTVWEDAVQRGTEALTQAIGRLAWERNCQALRFPSSAHRPDGVNVVLFPDRLLAGLKVDHSEKLPKKET